MAKVISFLMYESTIQGIKTDGSRNDTFIINPMVALHPKFIPSNFSFSFWLGLYDLKLSDDSKIVLHIHSPSGKEVFSLEVKVNGENQKPLNNLAKAKTLTLNVDARNVELPEVGDYLLSAVIDGEKVDQTLIIPVSK